MKTKLLLALAALLALGDGARAMETRYFPNRPRAPFRLTVFLVDFTDEHTNAVPPHRAWQTNELIAAAFFGTDFSPTDTNGMLLASGSIGDFVRRNLPGAVFAGEVYRYAAGAPTREGWFQYAPLPGEVFQSSTELNELGWTNFYTSFFARLGISWDWLRTNQNAVYILHGDGGGTVRYPNGATLGNSGLGNPRDPATPDEVPRFNWLGTLQHEIMHLVLGADDFYGNIYQGDTLWDILSTGNGLGGYPAGVMPWGARVFGEGRTEHFLGKGESALLTLPVPTPANSRQMVVVDNSSVGAADELVIEYRRARTNSAGGRFDTMFNGLPPGNPDGLLVMDVDRQARGLFFSAWNTNGTLPEAFSAPASAPETVGTTINYYGITPIVAIKRRGGVYDDGNTLFPAGAAVRGSDPSRPGTDFWRSSANRDGDVLWEITNTQSNAADFQFSLQFQGKAVSAEAKGGTATWVSAAGDMIQAPSPNPIGWVYDNDYFRASSSNSIRHHNLWIQTNRRGSASDFWAEGNFAHRVAPTGERLTGAWWVPEAGAPTAPVRVLLSVTFAGTPQTVLDMVATSGGEREFSVDLTPWAGRLVGLTLRIEAQDEASIGLVGAYFFRKSEQVAYDFVRRAEEARALSPPVTPWAPVSDPEGLAGRESNVVLEDGVCYGQALFLRPQSVSRGQARFLSPPIRVPSMGAVLRATLGYPASATGFSDGAMVRFTIDDGVHRLPLRDWTPPLVRRNATLVATGTRFSDPRFDGPDLWASGLAWGGEFHRVWDEYYNRYWRGGDWVRTGDFNGDGRDDVVVFTGGDHPRAAVALSTGTSFGPLTAWHEWFALTGERPMAGRFNADNLADIITFTPGGEAYVALSTGASFSGTGVRWGTGLARAGEFPLLGDVNGDGLDDVVIFVNYPGSGRLLGSVWVALNDGGLGFLPAVQWSPFFCVGPELPLVADVTRDGKADILNVIGDGSVYVCRSTGANFDSGSWWLRTNGPVSFNGSAYGPRGQEPTPAAHWVEGAVPFVATYEGYPQLIWFTRAAYSNSMVPTDWGSTNEVWVASMVETNRFSLPQRYATEFCPDENWPLVGDFNGDGRFDVGQIASSGAHVADSYARFLDDPRSDLLFPGDLYISPKPANVSFLGELAQSGRPRLNRIAMDLSRFAGQTIRLEITIDAGPGADWDLIYFPDLKLYRKDQAPPRMNITAAATGLQLNWSLVEGFRLQETGSLDPLGWKDSPEFIQELDGQATVFLKPGQTSQKFYRLIQP